MGWPGSECRVGVGKRSESRGDGIGSHAHSYLRRGYKAGNPQALAEKTQIRYFCRLGGDGGVCAGAGCVLTGCDFTPCSTEVGPLRLEA